MNPKDVVVTDEDITTVVTLRRIVHLLKESRAVLHGPVTILGQRFIYRAWLNGDGVIVIKLKED